jgi:L-2-amino-thiazoline-4-carboxylic acid hydrolase
MRSEPNRRTAADSAAGDPIAMECHELTDDFARMDVTDCAYAQFFRNLGEPELGHLLVCENDEWFAKGLGDIEFERHRTIMEGADHCDFLYRRIAPST